MNDRLYKTAKFNFPGHFGIMCKTDLLQLDVTTVGKLQGVSQGCAFALDSK